MSRKKNQVGENGQEATPFLDKETEEELGKKLREAFSDVFNQPVPERFRELIQSLSKATKQ